MVNAMVERATSNMLIGPDWAMNLGICDMLNNDPVQAKDVVKGIKKRIGSKNPKVQLLSLTLLETIVKNCGDMVHMHVAEKGVLHEMVRIVKKKPDSQVKEKILVLIHTWQEAFGGPRARYPQYYAVYQELLRAGAVFPQGSEVSAPVFTPPQTQPLSSYPPNIRNPGPHNDMPEASAEPDFPTLSLSEIQNAKGIMDVLAEMLNALDPGNKEGLRQEVIVDLVEQCRTYKQRVVHLVNSTSDESLLCQGLALNDDLERVLANYDAVASENPSQMEKPKPEPEKSVADANGPLIDTGDNSNQANGATSSSGTGLLNQLALPAPPAPNGPLPSAAANSKIDLLSGDDLALVPVTAPQPASPVASGQNALVLIDMFSDNTSSPNPAIATISSSAPPSLQQPSTQPVEAGLRPSGFAPNMGYSQFEQPSYGQGVVSSAWNGQPPPQPLHLQHPQQSSSPAYGNNFAPSNGVAQDGTAFPPPPWEAAHAQDSSPTPDPSSSFSPPMQVVHTHPEPVYNGSYPQQHNQMGGGLYMHPTPNQPFPTNQPLGLGFHPQQMTPPQVYGNQMGGSGYGQPQQWSPYLDQQMYSLSIRDDGSMRNPSSRQASSSAPSYLPLMKPKSNPEDKLFGDLVDISKFKPAKPASRRAGIM